MSVHVGEVEGLGGDGQPQPISPDDLTQYHVAAEIANMTVLNVANECVVGRRVVDLCTAGDKMIADAVCLAHGSPHVIPIPALGTNPRPAACSCS
jgi:hypothetical protein